MEPKSAPDPSTRAAFEALMAFWSAAGLDVTEARSLALRGGASVETRPSAPVQPPVERPTQARPNLAQKAIEEARELAAGAESLQGLKSALEGFNGCPLKKTARNLVFMDGAAAAPIMIIGDHPRKEDDDIGQPFAGEAGALLDRMLAAIGLSRQSDVQLINAVFWRPPGDRAPTRAELALCLPFLARAISLAQPRLLLLMGQAAADAVLGANDGLMKLRGRKHRYGEREFTQPLNAMVMPHPAYLLKRPQDKRLAWDDLLVFEEALKALNLARRDFP